MSTPNSQNSNFSFLKQLLGWILIVVGAACLIFIALDHNTSSSHEETILSDVLSFLALIVGIIKTGLISPIIKLPDLHLGNRKWVIIMSVLLVLLVASASVNLYYFAHRASASQSGTTSSSIVVLSGSTVTLVNQTPTPTPTLAPTPSPTAAPGPYGGTLAFKDSLRDDGQQHYFQTNLGSNNSGCKITDQGYVITASNYYYNCNGSDTFTNFVFQVTATAGQGSSAGIIFRSDNGPNDYNISIDQTGCYGLSKSANLFQTGSTTTQSSYQMTLVAKGSSFVFYVNGKNVAHFQDSSFSSGSIGLFVTGSCQNGMANTEATFTDASVWKL